jgi:hypothetical protein
VHARRELLHTCSTPNQCTHTHTDASSLCSVFCRARTEQSRATQEKFAWLHAWLISLPLPASGAMTVGSEQGVSVLPLPEELATGQMPRLN